MMAAMLIMLFIPSSCVSEKDDDTPLWSLATGDKVPGFHVTLDDGSLFSLSDIEHSICLIFFFDIDCSDCRTALPELQRTAQRLVEKGMADVRVICISRGGDPGAIAEFWTRNSLTLPFSAQPDDRVYRLFANRIVPRYYVTLPGNPPVIGAYTTILWPASDAVRTISGLR